ncbi:MAG: hypothetical protein EG828_03840 [Deltaproteobacteria bacterium]|nr:hypothetical protein [Deltaproteobacteria bacterium]
MAMKLLTKEIIKKLPIYSKIEDLEPEETLIIVKFHSRLGWSGYVVSADHMPDGEIEFYGIISDPDGIGLGFFDLSTLKDIEAERDKFFKPSLASDVLDGLVK